MKDRPVVSSRLLLILASLFLAGCQSLPDGWMRDGLVIDAQEAWIVIDKSLNRYGIETKITCVNNASTPLNRLVLEKPLGADIDLTSVKDAQNRSLRLTDWSRDHWYLDFDLPLIPGGRLEFTMTYTVLWDEGVRTSRLITEDQRLLPQIPDGNLQSPWKTAEASSPPRTHFVIHCRDPEGLRTVVSGKLQGQHGIDLDTKRFVTGHPRRNACLYTGPIAPPVQERGVFVFGSLEEPAESKEPGPVRRRLQSIAQRCAAIRDGLEESLGPCPCPEPVTLVIGDLEKVHASGRTLFLPQEWGQTQDSVLLVELARQLAKSWVGPFGLRPHGGRIFAVALPHYLGLRALMRTQDEMPGREELARCADSLRRLSSWDDSPSKEHAALFFAIDEVFARSISGSATAIEKTIGTMISTGISAGISAGTSTGKRHLTPSSFREAMIATLERAGTENAARTFDSWFERQEAPIIEFDWRLDTRGSLEVELSGPSLPLRLSSQIWRQREPARRFIERDFTPTSRHVVLASQDTFWLDLDPDGFWPVKFRKSSPLRDPMSDGMATRLSRSFLSPSGQFGQDPRLIWQPDSEGPAGNQRGTWLRLRGENLPLSLNTPNLIQRVARGRATAFPSWNQSWDIYEGESWIGRIWVDEAQRIDAMALSHPNGALDLQIELKLRDDAPIPFAIVVRAPELNEPVSLSPPPESETSS